MMCWMVFEPAGTELTFVQVKEEEEATTVEVIDEVQPG